MKTLLFILFLIYLGAYFAPLEFSPAPKPSFICTEESEEDYCDDGLRQYVNIP